MWLFHRNPRHLDKKERTHLVLLFECASELKQAYDLQERLTHIFDEVLCSNRIHTMGFILRSKCAG